MWPAALGAGGEDDGAIVFLPPSAVAHDPAVLGPFDGGGSGGSFDALDRGAAEGGLAALERDVQQGGIAADRTAATAAAVQAIARGHICAPSRAAAPPAPGGHRAEPWQMEASLGWGSHVSRADLQDMLDDIPAPESGDEDADSAASSSPRPADQGPSREPGDGAQACAAHARANYAGGDVCWGRPLADGSHYPPGEQRVIELEALMRAKDRELQQRDADARGLRAHLEHVERERDLHLSRSADWEAKARDWECENSALRKELAHAKSSVGVLEAQSQKLQDQLSKATASVNTLQLRVDELLQTDPNTTAAQYEHHLTQLRAEAHTARSDAEAWRHEAADLRAILEEKTAMDMDAIPHAAAHAEREPNRQVVTCDVGAQTVAAAALTGEAVGAGGEGSAAAGKRDVIARGGRAAHLVAQHLLQHADTVTPDPFDSPTDNCGSRTGSSDAQREGVARAAGMELCELALTSKVAALELEIETLRRALHSAQALGSADSKAGGGCAPSAEDLRAADVASAANENKGCGSNSLLAQVQHEFADLRRLNTQLVQANQALAQANDKLMAECGELRKRVSATAVAGACGAAASAHGGRTGPSATGTGSADKSLETACGTLLASGGNSGGSTGGNNCGGGMGPSSLSPAEVRHMARVSQQRQAAESEKLHAAALQDLGKQLKAQFAARETMLLEVLPPCLVCAGVLWQDARCRIRGICLVNVPRDACVSALNPSLRN